MSDEPFWMVYDVGQREPAQRHPSYDSALREASRLARLSPATTFLVLTAITAVAQGDLSICSYRSLTMSKPEEADEEFPL